MCFIYIYIYIYIYILNFYEGWRSINGFVQFSTKLVQILDAFSLQGAFSAEI